MRFADPKALKDTYDLVVVGTGFGSLFFVKKFLERQPRSRVLMLEWGKHHSHDWQIENRRNSDITDQNALQNQGDKPWLFTVCLGGGTNCWWGLSPRMLPDDFQVKTRFGHSVDWPITYDDLVPYYNEAERIIRVAGPDNLGAYYPDTPRYPMRPHNVSSVDRLLMAAMPDKHFAMPNGRLSAPLGSRGACCASGSCNLCPVDAKMTALNTLDGVLQDARVDLIVEAKVEWLDSQGGRITGAQFTHGGREYSAKGDLYILGANAIYSPAILMRSGIGGHGVGSYLCEKMFVGFEVLLDGLKHFDGGTDTTCFNLSFLDYEHRKAHGGAMVLIENRMRHGLRPEWGRWRETLPVGSYVEDEPLEANGIVLDHVGNPIAKPFTRSAVAERGKAALIEKLPDLLKALPIEKIRYRETGTSAHIQCTTRMGKTIEDSVVDSGLVHHTLRNLVIVGNSVFPTPGSGNPSLTTAALSLRAADRLGRSA